MSWVKLCDRTFTRRAVGEAGFTATALWGAMMCHSAHERLDGVIEPEEIDQAWTRGFAADVEIWGLFIAEHVAEEIAELEALAVKAGAKLRERLLGVIAKLSARLSEPELDGDELVEALTERLCDAGLLLRPRGRGTAYRLQHPDGTPYLRRDGGHQISREEDEERRRKAREKKSAQRARARTADQIRRAIDLGITGAQGSVIARDSEVSPGDVPGDGSGDTPRDEIGAAPAGVDRAPSGGTLSSAGSAGGGDRGGSATSSSPEDHQTRPARGQEEDELDAAPAPGVASIGDARAVRACIRAHAPLAPLADDLTPRVLRLAKRNGVPIGHVLAAIAETAEIVEWQLSDRVHDPVAWIRGTLHRCIKQMTRGRVSELEWAATKRDANRRFQKRARTLPEPEDYAAHERAKREEEWRRERARNAKPPKALAAAMQRGAAAGVGARDPELV